MGRKAYGLGLGFIEMARATLEKTSVISFARRALELLVPEYRVTATVWQRISAFRPIWTRWRPRG